MVRQELRAGAAAAEPLPSSSPSSARAEVGQCPASFFRGFSGSCWLLGVVLLRSFHLGAAGPGITDMEGVSQGRRIL